MYRKINIYRTKTPILLELCVRCCHQIETYISKGKVKFVYCRRRFVVVVAVLISVKNKNKTSPKIVINY